MNIMILIQHHMFSCSDKCLNIACFYIGRQVRAEQTV